jgi:phenylalanyl-tRNA synthetase alpha chain
MGQLLEKGMVGGEGCAITLTGDVYRKDEIDATHHVVHHQMEGLRLRKVQVGPEDVDLEHAWRRAKYEVDRELRALLEGVMRYVYCGLMRESSGQGQDVASSIQEWEDLLQQAQNDLVSGRTTNHTVEKHLQEAADVADIQMLYRPHLIPYVSPGYEMDIKVQDDSCSGNSSKWLEVLGCGVIHDEVLRNAGLDPQKYVGWAYGIGLERVAMRLLGIPDIRRMWELQNPNLLEQGAKMRRIIREAMTGESWVAARKSGALSGEKLRWNDLPYSQYPPVTRAMTIRLPDLMEGSSIHMLTCWNDVYELLNTIIKESEKTTDLYIESVTEKVQDWESYYSDNWSAAKKERYLARKALAESGLLKTLEIRCRSQDRTLRGEEVEALLQEISQEVERRGGYIQ